MKKFFIWLTFFHKYYIRELIQYTKPIKTNIIKHSDLSALIDPYIQAYISYYHSNKIYFEMNKDKYYEFHKNYILPKLLKIIVSDKNKYISPVFLDICAYFSSKIREVSDNIDTLKRIKETTIHLDIEAPEFKNKAIMDLLKISGSIGFKSVDEQKKTIEAITTSINNVTNHDELERVVLEYYNRCLEKLNSKIKMYANVVNIDTLKNEFEDTLDTLLVETL